MRSYEGNATRNDESDIIITPGSSGKAVEHSDGWILDSSGGTNSDAPLNPILRSGAPSSSSVRLTHQARSFYFTAPKEISTSVVKHANSSSWAGRSILSFTKSLSNFIRPDVPPIISSPAQAPGNASGTLDLPLPEGQDDVKPSIHPPDSSISQSKHTFLSSNPESAELLPLSNINETHVEIPLEKSISDGTPVSSMQRSTRDCENSGTSADTAQSTDSEFSVSAEAIILRESTVSQRSSPEIFSTVPLPLLTHSVPADRTAIHCDTILATEVLVSPEVVDSRSISQYTAAGNAICDEESDMGFAGMAPTSRRARLSLPTPPHSASSAVSRSSSISPRLSPSFISILSSCPTLTQPLMTAATTIPGMPALKPTAWAPPENSGLSPSQSSTLSTELSASAELYSPTSASQLAEFRARAEVSFPLVAPFDDAMNPSTSCPSQLYSTSCASRGSSAAEDGKAAVQMCEGISPTNISLIATSGLQGLAPSPDNSHGKHAIACSGRNVPIHQESGMPATPQSSSSRSSSKASLELQTDGVAPRVPEISEAISHRITPINDPSREGSREERHDRSDLSPRGDRVEQQVEQQVRSELEEPFVETPVPPEQSREPRAPSENLTNKTLSMPAAGLSSERLSKMTWQADCEFFRRSCANAETITAHSRGNSSSAIALRSRRHLEHTSMGGNVREVVYGKSPVVPPINTRKPRDGLLGKDVPECPCWNTGYCMECNQCMESSLNRQKYIHCDPLNSNPSGNIQNVDGLGRGHRFPYRKNTSCVYHGNQCVRYAGVGARVAARSNCRMPCCRFRSEHSGAQQLRSTLFAGGPRPPTLQRKTNRTHARKWNSTVFEKALRLAELMDNSMPCYRQCIAERYLRGCTCTIPS